MTPKVEQYESREIWTRTGKIIQESSTNNKGIITLEEEKSHKTRKTRLVATGYRTLEKKPKIMED